MVGNQTNLGPIDFDMRKIFLWDFKNRGVNSPLDMAYQDYLSALIKYI